MHLVISMCISIYFHFTSIKLTEIFFYWSNVFMVAKIHVHVFTVNISPSLRYTLSEEDHVADRGCYLIGQ